MGKRKAADIVAGKSKVPKTIKSYKTAADNCTLAAIDDLIEEVETILASGKERTNNGTKKISSYYRKQDKPNCPKSPISSIIIHHSHGEAGPLNPTSATIHVTSDSSRTNFLISGTLSPSQDRHTKNDMITADCSNRYAPLTTLQDQDFLRPIKPAQNDKLISNCSKDKRVQTDRIGKCEHTSELYQKLNLLQDEVVALKRIIWDLELRISTPLSENDSPQRNKKHPTEKTNPHQIGSFGTGVHLVCLILFLQMSVEVILTLLLT